MSKSYRPWSPRQSFLLPPSPLDWLPEDHFVYFVLDVIEDLDLAAIEGAIQEKDGRGNRPFDPRMMVALLICGYCAGVRSSRKLEQATHTDVAFRVVTGGLHPDHTAICDFRRIHRLAFGEVFVEVLRLCQAAGLVKLAHVSLDGTKIEANASRHKAMSHSRMVKTQARLEEEIARLLDEAESVDRDEDATYGPGKRGDEIPEDLRRRESRLRKIREAKAALEAEAARTRALDLREQEERAKEDAKAAPPESNERKSRRARRIADRAKAAAEKARELAKKRQQDALDGLDSADLRGTCAEKVAAQQALAAASKDLATVLNADLGAREATELPEHHVPANGDGDPAGRAQRNFTDPDSRIQKTSGGYVQGFNAQIVVDDANQIIVAHGLTNQPPDAQHLPAMVDQVEKNCGSRPHALTADAGYWAERNATHCEKRGIDAHISVRRDHPGSERTGGWRRSSAMEAMKAKLESAGGKALYARRKATVEPVFGQIKERLGFRRMLVRGIEQAKAEWALVCACSNLQKLFRHGTARRAA
jgi:transposase